MKQLNPNLQVEELVKIPCKGLKLTALHPTALKIKFIFIVGVSVNFFIYPSRLRSYAHCDWLKKLSVFTSDVVYVLCEAVHYPCTS